jgi:uncharacterized protein YdaU (DUF1376 family)
MRLQCAESLQDAKCNKGYIINYYQHHIGDFNNATRHLTRIERSIYRDMVELYYDTEKPLSCEVATICRKVVARSEEEKSAVLALLDEFFVKTEEGYVHERCEEELSKARDAMIEATDRRQNEKERQRRNRERRASMFAKLREFDEVPAWNTSTELLQSRIDYHLSRVTASDETCTSLTKTGTDTANHIPLPTTHIPITNLKENTPIPPEGGDKRESRKSSIALKTYLAECKASGTQAIPSGHPIFDYAAEAKIPEDFLRLQWLEFRDRYCEDGAKRYRAWPTVFGKSVRGNWFKLWYFDNSGACALTTTGIQARNTHEARK